MDKKLGTCEGLSVGSWRRGAKQGRWSLCTTAALCVYRQGL